MNLHTEVSACYSISDLTDVFRAGLIGYVDNMGGGEPMVNACYFNSDLARTIKGIAESAAPISNTQMNKTTAELQSPTESTGIYEDWNLDIDGNPTTDVDEVVWSFCGNDQYPVLRIDFNRNGLATVEEFKNPCELPINTTHSVGGDPQLINITTLEQLDAIRYDLDGNGRPAFRAESVYQAAFSLPSRTNNTCLNADGNIAPCHGYELMANLDFKMGSTDPANFSIWAEESTAPGAISTGFVPIGGTGNFSAIFNGNGHTISNLYIESSGGQAYVGLFTLVQQAGKIHNLGIEAGYVRLETSDRGISVGILAGGSRGTITACYAKGSVEGRGRRAAVGGLVGSNIGGLFAGGSRGTITACYAKGSVEGRGRRAAVGGLVGSNIGGLFGGKSYGTITACYAKGSVMGTEYGANLGGLVGSNTGRLSACYATESVEGTGDGANLGGIVGSNTGPLSACYAIGSVEGTGDSANLGGIVGSNASGAIHNSYFDRETSALAIKVGIGNENDPYSMDKKTAELQSLTGPTGIYAGWNLDIDGNTTTEADQVVWIFCSNDQYPILRVDANGDGQATPEEFNNPCGSNKPGGKDPPPSIEITSMSPDSGPVGTKVILTGIGFSKIPARNRVIFNGVADLSTDDVAVEILVSVSTTEITLRVPAGAVTGRIRVILEGETATSSEDFTVRAEGSDFDVAVFGVAGLEDGKLGVYPNPADRMIRFKGLSVGSRYTYLLYTITGRKALAGSLERETINIGALSAGQYILVLQDDRLTEVLREVILIE